MSVIVHSVESAADWDTVSIGPATANLAVVPDPVNPEQAIGAAALNSAAVALEFNKDVRIRLSQAQRTWLSNLLGEVPDQLEWMTLGERFEFGQRLGEVYAAVPVRGVNTETKRVRVRQLLSLCVGLNYREIADEAGVKTPTARANLIKMTNILRRHMSVEEIAKLMPEAEKPNDLSFLTPSRPRARSGRPVVRNSAPAEPNYKNVTQRQIRSIRLLTRAEEVALAKRVESGDFAAKSEFVERNLRLAGARANHFSRGTGVPESLLIGPATEGLIRAVEKFDWRKGFKLSTYAILAIDRAIIRSLPFELRPIRPSAAVSNLERKLQKLEEEYRNSHRGESPSDAYLAEATDTEEDEVAYIRNMRSAIVSLDARVGDDEYAATRGELQVDDRPPVDEIVSQREESSYVRRMVANLPDLQRQVVILHHGLHGGKAETLSAVARRMGRRRKEVVKLYNGGITKLQELMIPESPTLAPPEGALNDGQQIPQLGLSAYKIEPA